VTDRPFADRAVDAMSKYGHLVVGLDPSGDLLSAWGLGDTPDGLDRFVEIAIEACVGTVGVVKPQAAFYERHGWRGIRSLATLAQSCRQAGLLVLLDAKRGDVGSTNVAYAEAYLGDDAGIPVDAITVTPYVGFEAMTALFDKAIEANASVFVVTRSTNTEGRSLQTALHPDGKAVEHRILLQIAAVNDRVAPGRLGPIGSVFGPIHGYPEGMDLDKMNGLFLAPGLGAQGATADRVAQCFRDCPDRVLASASRSILAQGPDPSGIRKSAQTLSDQLARALHS
jgi:orotidine-5'-phosphate decarboxylase